MHKIQHGSAESGFKQCHAGKGVLGICHAAGPFGIDGGRGDTPEAIDAIATFEGIANGGPLEEVAGRNLRMG